jgi:hypothetical protein
MLLAITLFTDTRIKIVCWPGADVAELAESIADDAPLRIDHVDVIFTVRAFHIVFRV